MNSEPDRPSSYVDRFLGSEVAQSYVTGEYGAQSYSSLVWEVQRPVLRDYLLQARERHPNGRHLDFACGTGRITQLAEGVFAEVDGMDISPAMVDLARKVCPQAHFFVGNVLENPELCLGPYTSLTSFRLLLNLDPPLRHPILLALHARLASEGVLIVNFHGNSHSLRQPAILWKRRKKPADRPPGSMLNSISPGEAVACLEAAGFQVEKRYGVGILPPTLYRLPLRSFWIGLDRFLSRLPFLEHFCIDLMYVCKPKTSRP